jgi:hypothetical protein
VQEELLDKELYIEALEGTIEQLKTVLLSVANSNDLDFIKLLCKETLSSFYEGDKLLKKEYQENFKDKH